MHYSVRRAGAGDLDILADFAVAEAMDAEGLELDRTVARRGVEAGLSDRDVAIYWVAESGGGEIAGAASAVREWSNWRAAYYWWIQSMYVPPGHRGRGVAGILIEAIAAEARRSGAADLRLLVHGGNERAIAAYRRSGFGRIRYDVMARPLDDE